MIDHAEIRFILLFNKYRVCRNDEFIIFIEINILIVYSNQLFIIYLRIHC